MATGAMDGRLRIWDLRNSFTPLTSVSYGTPTAISFSQRGLLAYSCANSTRVIFWKNFMGLRFNLFFSQIYSEVGYAKKPFLKHMSHGNVFSSQFCPYEDVLGLGTSRGFDSCLVPGTLFLQIHWKCIEYYYALRCHCLGAGEANFDALEQNIFQTKKQRREAEVKALLEKVI